MTILVLAPPGDATALRFAEFAEARGNRVVVSDGRFDEVAVTVMADRNGAARVDLRVAGEEVRGVFNRGIRPPDIVGSDAAAGEAVFVHAESLAVWWSALALWHGPVVNRPSTQGFLPHFDPLEARDLPGVGLPSSSIGVQPDRVPAGERINVRRVRDGAFLGHGTDGTSRGVDEILQFTHFHPERTRHILLAGDGEFDLSESTGHLSSADGARLAPIVKRLRTAGVTFCLFVVQPEDEGIRLLDFSCHPMLHQFGRLKEQVFRSLLRSLLAGPS
ncbi:hypothetical protein [Streptacidiphilus sp. EB103A]|uniref:hypothetical protein n=1 Tax=Streptacidiphilus sp. EB103A TaxID=3156275 RepID=UPI003512101A